MTFFFTYDGGCLVAGSHEIRDSATGGVAPHAEIACREVWRRAAADVASLTRDAEPTCENGDTLGVWRQRMRERFAADWLTPLPKPAG